MILHVRGRLLLVDLLPPPARPVRTWDGADQARPFSPIVAFAHAIRSVGGAMASLADGPPPRRRSALGSRHVR